MLIFTQRNRSYRLSNISSTKKKTQRNKTRIHGNETENLAVDEKKNSHAFSARRTTVLRAEMFVSVLIRRRARLAQLGQRARRLMMMKKSVPTTIENAVSRCQCVECEWMLKAKNSRNRNVGQTCKLTAHKELTVEPFSAQRTCRMHYIIMHAPPAPQAVW